VFHRKAVGLHCRGLVDSDAAKLLEAAVLYGKAGRRLPRAQALEAVGAVLLRGCRPASGPTESGVVLDFSIAGLGSDGTA
jgi:hypothetical protein